MKNRHVAKYAMAQVDTLELMEKEYINQAGANWIPATSAFLFHTIGDEVVPFVNFEKCLAAWKGSDKVKAFRCEGLTQSHVTYGKAFTFIGYEDDEIFSILLKAADIKRKH